MSSVTCIDEGTGLNLPNTAFKCLNNLDILLRVTMSRHFYVVSQRDVCYFAYYKSLLDGTIKLKTGHLTYNVVLHIK